MIAGAIKRGVRSIVAQLCHASRGGVHASRGKVAILAYHRVVTPDDLQRQYIEPGMYVMQDVFEMQVRWLMEHCNVISFSDLLQQWKARAWDQEKPYCVLTFDDGWLDNYLYAFPILKKYQAPASIFLPTNYVGSNEWFWPEKIAFLLTYLRQPRVTATQRSSASEVVAELPGMVKINFVGQEVFNYSKIREIIGRCKLLKPRQIGGVLHRLSDILGVSVPHERMTINWEEVNEMAEKGISFGSHSCAHHLLTRLDEQTIRQELQESNQVLRALPVGYLPVFCYPNGDNTDAIQDLVKESGYVAAVGTRNGMEGQCPKNLYELNRIGMHNDVSKTAELFSLHLARAAWGL